MRGKISRYVLFKKCDQGKVQLGAKVLTPLR